MSSGHTVGSLDTWQPDDKSFNKRILREGRGDLTPNDESVCIVHVVSIGTSRPNFVTKSSFIHSYSFNKHVDRMQHITSFKKS